MKVYFLTNEKARFIYSVVKELMHLKKVSIHVSLRSPRRLTWVETFC